MTTRIVKWGNSQGIRLPKTLLALLRISDNDAVEVEAEMDKIIIKKAAAAPKHKTIEELFAGYNGDYVPDEMDWGSPVGREVW